MDTQKKSSKKTFLAVSAIVFLLMTVLYFWQMPRMQGPIARTMRDIGLMDFKIGRVTHKAMCLPMHLGYIISNSYLIYGSINEPYSQEVSSDNVSEIDELQEFMWHFIFTKNYWLGSN